MSDKLRFFCEARYRSGKSFIIPFTTELDSKLTGIALCAELRRKYPDSEFWIEDYCYLDFDILNKNQTTNPGFGYDGCYDSLIIIDNYVINRIPEVHITSQFEVNINSCKINNKNLRLDYHYTKDLKTFVRDQVYEYIARKLLRSCEEFQDGIQAVREFQKHFNEFSDSLFANDVNMTCENSVYVYKEHTVTFSCKILKTIEDLIPHL